jgi:hypothetical protein
MGLTEIAPLDRQKQILTPSKIVRVPRGHPLTERLTGDSALLRTWKRTGIAKAGGAKSLKCLSRGIIGAGPLARRIAR